MGGGASIQNNENQISNCIELLSEDVSVGGSSAQSLILSPNKRFSTLADSFIINKNHNSGAAAPTHHTPVAIISGKIVGLHIDDAITLCSSLNYHIHVLDATNPRKMPYDVLRCNVGVNKNDVVAVLYGFF